MRRRRTLLVLAVAGLALVATFLVVLLRPSGGTAELRVRDGRVSFVAPAKRKPLPDLQGPALTPPPSMLRLRVPAGRPAFIDVWASWCVPCREEAPLLARLWRSHRNQVRFLGIDVQDSQGDARTFARRYGLGYPSIFDRSAALANKLGFFGLPTAFLVDRRGRIAAKLVGKQKGATLRAALAALARK